ncbi:MAG: PAS domain-containing protein, partial [Opitutaceae bacterium]
MVATLQQRNAELERQLAQARETLGDFEQLSDDFNNLFASSDVGTVFLDRELRVRKFSPALKHFFRLGPEAVGRPVDQIADQLEGKDEMLQQVKEVLQTGQSIESEVLSREGRWFLKRSLPYFSTNQAIDGVIITFTEISANKAMHSRFDLAIESSRLVWWEWDVQSGHLA